MEIRKNSLIKTAAISFLLTIFLSASAYAQPNITSFSGSLTDGSTITINGNNFGVNGPNIVVFDDFESGTNGNNIKTGAGSATIGQWNGIGGGDKPAASLPKYDNSFKVSGGMAFRGNATIATLNGTTDAGSPAYTNFTATSDIFVSYWYYMPSTSDWSCYNNGICNNKLVWVVNTCCNVDDRVIPTNAPANKTTNNSFYMFGNDSIGEPPLSPSLNMSKGKWYRFWGYLHGAGNATDHEELWVASPSSEANLAATRRINRTTQIWQTTFAGFKRIYINAYQRWCNDCAESAPTFDDVYVAIGTGARARVEIGDAATYATSKNLTIASVTSWSDTSITATIRQGSFSNLNNAYLYVIDADGNVNENGYLLSDGGGNTTPPPPSDSSGSGDTSSSGGSGCGFVKDEGKGTGSGLNAIDIGIASLLLLLLHYKLRKLYKINLWTLLIFSIITIAIANNVEAATLEVGAGKTHSTIQAAVDAAQAGDTVLVYAGIYTDSILIGTSGGTYFPADANKYANVVLKNSGASGSKITIKSAGNDSSSSSASGGSGCGFVKDSNGKGQGAKGEELSLMILLFLLLILLRLSKARYRRLFMRKLNIIFLAVIFVFLNANISLAAVNLPWNTTYNCPDWIQGQSVSTNCGDLQRFGDRTCDNGNGKEQITSAANYSGGAGGKGQRHWLGDGVNNVSGGLVLNLASPQSELWLRWYMRYEQSFQWNPLNNQKIVTIDPAQLVIGYNGFDGFRVWSYSSQQGYYSAAGEGWNGVMKNGSTDANGNKTSDGQWHLMEVHIKMDTNGSNGIAEVWIDGKKIINATNASLGGVALDEILIGNNGFAPTNGRCMAIDYDDIAISATGPIGPIGGGNQNSGGDTSSSGGSGCGFVKDDNGKGPKAKSEGLSLMIMLIIILAGVLPDDFGTTNLNLKLALPCF